MCAHCKRHIKDSVGRGRQREGWRMRLSAKRRRWREMKTNPQRLSREVCRWLSTCARGLASPSKSRHVVYVKVLPIEVPAATLRSFKLEAYTLVESLRVGVGRVNGQLNALDSALAGLGYCGFDQLPPNALTTESLSNCHA